MKAKRQKKIRQTFETYVKHFNFEKPYKLLVDGNFIKTCLDLNYDYQQKLQSLFGKRAEFVTTKCVVNELKTLGPMLANTLLSAQKLKQVNCTHVEEYLPANFCLKAFVGYKNPHKVVLATQDDILHEFYDKTKALPLIHFFRGNILRIRDFTAITKDILERMNRKSSQIRTTELGNIKEERRKLREEEYAKKKQKIKKLKNNLCIVTKKEAKKKRKSHH